MATMRSHTFTVLNLCCLVLHLEQELPEGILGKASLSKQCHHASFIIYCMALLGDDFQDGRLHNFLLIQNLAIMAKADKDEIDFSKLEKEVLGAMEAEARYSRENDAKFRAVNQKVATYEEFRDIVLASHLKPLEKKDKMPEVFVQPWNSTLNYTNSATTKSSNSSPQLQPHKIPTTSLGLVNDWRRLKNDDDKLNYLLAISGPRLKEIFKTEVSGGLLGDILHVLNSHKPESATEVTEILNAMASAKRFKLDLQFMSSKEKQECQKLFEMLSKECLSQSSTDDEQESRQSLVKEQTELPTQKADVQNPKCTTGPTAQDLNRLMKLFEITL